MPHFHIPLQSGSDDILKSMRRRYRTDLYRSRIERIKERMPDCCIGVDVITGFPGESDAHFAETQQFLIDLPVSYLHVFTYSERDNTTAVRIADVVPMDVRNLRTRQLRILSEKKKAAFYRPFAGTTRPVLWEEADDNGLMFGFTDNYLRVHQPWKSESRNSIEPVILGEYGEEGFAAAR
jgi:threonylcarbamoyladenosine tRNA methylthiotransferase MtaB